MENAWEFGAVFVRLKEVLGNRLDPVRDRGFAGGAALVGAAVY